MTKHHHTSQTAVRSPKFLFSEMTRTINFCINSKDKQENVSIKLEAFMPDDKTKAAATEFNAQDVFKEINE